MEHSRNDFVYEVARMYYEQNATMDSIAQQLDVSRSTISRLLSEARDSGVVQITLERRDEDSSKLERAFSAHFGVDAHIVTSDAVSDVHRGTQIASVAARLLTNWMRPGSVLAVSAGSTIQAVANSLPSRHYPGSSVVQLHGSIGPLRNVAHGSSQAVLGTVAAAFGAEEHPFPVPAFFDFATTRRSMWHERSIQRVRAMQSHADIALFGAGSFRGPDRSWPYTSGLLSDEDLDELRREHVVGDVCTVMMRPDGSSHNIAVNHRTSGASRRELAHVPRRLLVAFGASKALPVLAALRAGIATDIVIDDVLAHSITTMFPSRHSTRRLDAP